MTTAWQASKKCKRPWCRQITDAGGNCPLGHDQTIRIPCTKCGITFEKFDNGSVCRPCTNEASNLYAKTQTSKDIKKRYAAKNVERCKRWQKDWMENNLDHVREYRKHQKKKYKMENREKHRAHKAISKAVGSGRIKRQPCEVCGDRKSHGHHDDYTKRLDVRWLCSKHHHEVHRDASLGHPRRIYAPVIPRGRPHLSIPHDSKS